MPIRYACACSATPTGNAEEHHAHVDAAHAGTDPGFAVTVHPHRGVDPAYRRDIMCRACAGEIRHEPSGLWRHLHDGSPACLDPNTLQRQPKETSCS